jgi:putative flippase GtrA
MIKYFYSEQFLLFVIVGASAAFLHWISRLVLSYWFDFSLAVGLAYFVGMLIAFVLNRLYVFPKSIKPLSKQIFVFTITNLAFFPLVWFSSIEIHKVLVINKFTLYSEGIAHAIAISLPMLITFLIYKMVAFKEEI